MKAVNLIPADARKNRGSNAPTAVRVPTYALLGAPGVTCEFIADGVHSADETLSFAFGVVGPRRAALITDAMAAAGMPDGRYELDDGSVLHVFTAEWLPPEADPYKGVRIGRPARSPSLPPEDGPPTDTPPPQPPNGAP